MTVWRSESSSNKKENIKEAYLSPSHDCFLSRRKLKEEKKKCAKKNVRDTIMWIYSGLLRDPGGMLLAENVQRIFEIILYTQVCSLGAENVMRGIRIRKMSFYLA